MPRYRGWSFGTTSPRRHEAMTGTRRSSASRMRSVEQRAREDAGTGEDDRTLRAGEEMEDGTKHARVRPRRRRRSRGLAWHIAVDGLVEQVLSQERKVGPWRPVSASRRAAATAPGTSSAVIGSAADFARPPMVATRSISWNASRPRSRRATWPAMAMTGAESERAGVDPDGEVGRADRPRPEAQSRAPGQLADGVGHERRAALVTSRHDPDARRRQGLEQPEEALARDGERPTDPARVELLGDEPADGDPPYRCGWRLIRDVLRRRSGSGFVGRDRLDVDRCGRLGFDERFRIWRRGLGHLVLGRLVRSCGRFGLRGTRHRRRVVERSGSFDLLIGRGVVRRSGQDVVDHVIPMASR